MRRVVRACGENLYEVEDDAGVRAIYELPKRLRHVVFVRRGSFVFVREDATRGSQKCCGDIEVVVMDAFLNALCTTPEWPEGFRVREGRTADVAPADVLPQQAEDGFSEDESAEMGGWPALTGNPNRGRWDHVSDSEEEDEEDDGGEEAVNKPDEGLVSPQLAPRTTKATR